VISEGVQWATNLRISSDSKVFTILEVNEGVMEDLIKPEVKVSIHMLLVVLVLHAPLEGSFYEVRVGIVLAIPWFH
jgi:hypothetical protein